MENNEIKCQLCDYDQDEEFNKTIKYSKILNLYAHSECFYENGYIECDFCGNHMDDSIQTSLVNLKEFNKLLKENIYLKGVSTDNICVNCYIKGRDSKENKYMYQNSRFYINGKIFEVDLDNQLLGSVNDILSKSSTYIYQISVLKTILKSVLELELENKNGKEFWGEKYISSRIILDKYGFHKNDWVAYEQLCLISDQLNSRVII